MNTFVCISKMKTAIEMKQKKNESMIFSYKIYLFFNIIAINFNKFFLTEV